MSTDDGFSYVDKPAGLSFSPPADPQPGLRLSREQVMSYERDKVLADILRRVLKDDLGYVNWFGQPDGIMRLTIDVRHVEITDAEGDILNEEMQ